jgi:hypothetical protein
MLLALLPQRETDRQRVCERERPDQGDKQTRPINEGVETDSRFYFNCTDD